MRWVLLLFTSVAAAQPSPECPKPELVLQTGHSDWINAVAISPDGRWLASGSHDKTVKLWDSVSTLELRTFSGHTNIVWAVAFSPDGRWLASGSYDKTVKLWDAATGRELRTFFGHTGSVQTVAFSPNGRLLASGDLEGAINIWDIDSGRQFRALASHTHPLTLELHGFKPEVFSVAFSPDGRWLASAGHDGTITLWEVATGRELRTLSGHSPSVRAVAFSADGRWLASGAHDNTIKLWEVGSGREVRTFSGHTGAVNSVAFSFDGRWIASGSSDKTIRLWEVESGRELRSLSGHTDQVKSVAFSPHASWVASASFDKTIKFWGVSSGKLLGTLYGYAPPLTSVAFSPDGRWLASGGHDSIHLGEVARGHELQPLSCRWCSSNEVAFSPDGRSLATGSIGKVTLWDVASGRELRSFPDYTAVSHSLAFSPDGRWLAVNKQTQATSVTLLEVSSGREVRTFSGHKMVVTSAAFNPDGRMLATSGWDGTVKLWDVATGRELRTFSVRSGAEAVAFSPDGRLLASAIADNTLRLWDVASGREVHTLSGHTAMVVSVAFSPNGQWLASGSGDNQVKLWDVASGRELRTLAGHTSFVWSVTFRSDGRVLASASLDGSIRLWEIPSGKELVRLVTLNPPGWAVIGPDGRFDASYIGMELMHWVAGQEIIALKQLKERFYEPGLLAKVLGYNREPLRDIEGFDKACLFPEVRIAGPVTDAGMLNLELRDRGGGIGRVQVFVNDKEYRAFPAGSGRADQTNVASLQVDLGRAPGLMPGEPNRIRIVAWNRAGYLSSKGDVIEWTPPRPPERRSPELFGIVAGISSYASNTQELELPSAAEDAGRMAKAIELAGSRFLGKEHVHLTVLSSPAQMGTLPATKALLQRAFLEAQKARPKDLFVVYLSGHGVTVHGMYAYPTQEATTLELSDSALRERTAITSAELKEWIKKVPARHQVMILDTCAAGAAEAQLSRVRDIPGDQVRALEQLKDATGFYVLMGSAADAVSWETSQYGGLLTYALLQGMRGAALIDDQWVEIPSLFKHVEQTVRSLASDIGGIQKPHTIVPFGGDSFYLGKLLKEDREAIPLPEPKPIILRPSLMNSEQNFDDLDLTLALHRRLRETNVAKERGGKREEAKIVFVDAVGYPKAIVPSGTYSVIGKQVSVRLTLVRQKQKLAELQVTGSKDDVDGLAAKLADAIIASARQRHD